MRDQNGSNHGSAGERPPRRAGREVDDPGAPLERPVQLGAGRLPVDEADERGGEDAAAGAEAPVLVQPAVEGPVVVPQQVGVPAEGRLDGHGGAGEHQRRVDPLAVEQGQALVPLVRGRIDRADQGRAAAGQRAALLDRPHHSRSEPGSAVSPWKKPSGVSTVTGRPSTTGRTTPSISASWKARSPALGRHVPHEAVGRLVVVVVGVEGRVRQLGHVGPPGTAGESPTISDPAAVGGVARSAPSGGHGLRLCEAASR